MKLVKTPIAIMLLNLITHAAYAESSATNQTADEQSIEVIQVHSGYRTTNLQNTATSLSVLTEQDIAVRNGQNLEEIVGAAANVNFSSGSQRARYYQIRGIGERSQFKEPINPSVGLIIDNIDFSGIGSIASTFDIAQVELFRGPQGTQFGANALAGLIYMSSHQPSDEFEGAIRLSAGNYHSYSAGLALSGPASDKVNYRFSAEQYSSDGFITNTYLDREDTNNRDELMLRGKLAIEASKELTIDLALIHADFNNGYDAFSLDNDRNTLSDQPGFDEQQTTAASAKLMYRKFSGFDIVSIFSLMDSDLAYGYDEDWSYQGMHPYEYSSTDHYLRDRTNYTAEFRLVSNNRSQLFANTTDWVIGAYFKQDDEDLTRRYTYLDGDFSSDFSAKNSAVFAQLDSELTKKITLTSGVRVEQRDSDYHNSQGVKFSPDDSMVGGKLVLSYQADKDAMIYAAINKGYKSGSVNTSGSLTKEQRVFKPEYLWNYEVGYKRQLLNNDAYIRAAAFYMKRDDIQISSYHLDERSDGSSEFISYWDNAARGYNYGIELEAAWQVTQQAEYYASVGLLETEFEGYRYANGTIESGRDQAHAPQYQFNIGINYYLNDQWYFNVNLDGKDNFYFSDSHSEKSDSYVLMHGSISYQQANWQLKLWARNIFDKDYVTRGFYFGNDPRDGYDSKAYYQLGEPAVLGATLNYQF
ncbi:TonB-dependent receptor [Thalassotalea insulae]|uniref:TonB-dependent receptor n=1 Tax=Thalassotalea insulae TaxID=2056778 RepID=A0ABQ6GW81_9GAMM|nr:TonB-dependent receptor [Thalassotalea insulae]GLX78775.1 TonB-dependent receptor [Thalassotalea insulae]